jgi:hypothetical protein
LGTEKQTVKLTGLKSAQSFFCGACSCLVALQQVGKISAKQK